MGVYENILANDGVVKQAFLGISVSTKSSTAVVDEDGLLSIVEEFTIIQAASRGAASYNKLSMGDVFISASVNGGEEWVFTRRYHLTDLLLSVRMGDTVRFTVRNASGKVEQVSITFDKDEYFKIYA